MENVDSQLQTKYQKIATEYSKIRAQASVLKKAVIDEQTRNTDLREQLKEKEVEVRRAEQELDSLTFRNQQLTKRVTVLQEELDYVQNKGKKGRSKSSESKYVPPQPPNHILDEEFQKKIVENAQLLSEIGEKDGEIEELYKRIDQLERTVDLIAKAKAELEEESKKALNKLEKEKSDLQRQLNDGQEREKIPSFAKENGKRDEYERNGKVRAADDRRADISPTSSGSEFLAQRKSPAQDDTSDEIEVPNLFDLEKELAHWKTKYNIIQIKYDELAGKQNSQSLRIKDETLEPVQISNMLGRLTAPFPIPDEIEAREAKINDFFTREIDKLVAEKHLYHAKNLAIAANIEVLNVHLHTSESKREKCEEALCDTRSKYTSLQEDKEVQEGNYKAQLSTMSEHLANMNEKLIRQTEEIQQLKFELTNKNGKKGKQK